MTFQHVLFPVDFSERCESAARHVEAMAHHFGSKVTLLHSRWQAEIGEFTWAGAPYGLTPVEELNKSLETFGAKWLSSIQAEKIVEEGEPGKMIVQFAEQDGVDLIMMPSHGYGPFRSLLLGSITAKVLHDSRCPVWTGAHIDGAIADRHVLCQSIICAVDLSPRTDSLMKWSSILAGGMGATLRFVHAMRGSDAWADHQFGFDLTQELHKTARQQIMGFQEESGVEAPVCLLEGRVGSVVAEEAKRHGADLIVIGRGCITGSLGRLRTHAYDIIRESPCPVISV